MKEEHINFKKSEPEVFSKPTEKSISEWVQM